MDRRTVLAGLVASIAIACFGCSGGSDGAPSGASGAGGDDRHIDEGVIDGLLDPDVLDGGDQGADAGELDAHVPDAADGAVAGDASGTDSSAPACLSDADSDGVCDADDVCEGHDDAEDADGDMIPDGCDECPVGSSIYCDALIWKIELPHDSHPVADDAGDWIWAFNLIDGDAVYRVGLEMEADNVPRSYELGETQLREVRSFLRDRNAVTATLGFMTASQGPGPIGPPVLVSVDVECPFVPSAAVIKRISVEGQMSPTGTGHVTVEVRGYVTEP